MIGASRPLADSEGVRLARTSPTPARPVEAKREVAARKDEVEISAAAVRLQQAKEAVLAAPETRQDVVRRLRDQIQRGEYTVDTRDLARRIADVVA